MLYYTVMSMESFNENNLETMPVPEIEVKREQGIELLTRFLAEQKESLEDNDEAMEWIALSYSHPEYKDEILNKIRKDKAFIKNPEELYEKTINSLREYEKNATSLDVSDEMKKREEMIPKYKEQIEKSIEYFRPEIKTSDIKNVEIIPCDKVLPRIDKGRGITIRNISFIISHTENPDNFDHEFLHGVINPITEKFADYFESEEQRKKIFEFIGGGLKGYGDHPVSVLNEEIIQTYNEYIKGGGKERTLSDVRKELGHMKEEDFIKLKKGQGSNTNLQKPFEEFTDLDDLRARSEVFYEKFIKGQQVVKNELRKRLLSFYREYENAKELNTALSFEKYFSGNYKKILD